MINIIIRLIFKFVFNKYSFKTCEINLKKMSFILMMFSQSKLGWSLLELLDRSANFEYRAPLQKQETKRIDRDRPLPLRCLSQFFSVEEKINCLTNNEVLCVPFIDGVT